MRINTIAPQTFSSEYTFLYNDFNWLNINTESLLTIQSLAVSAPFFNLKKDLKILNDLNEYKDLGFELLVQRDIDKNRVKIEIVDNYLFLPDKIKFFPPLVVALIPSYKNIGTVQFSTQYNFTKDNLSIAIGNGEISQTFYTDNDYSNEDDSFKSFFQSRDIKYGSLKWDLEKFNAIVIDGQHRFFALLNYVEKNPNIELSKCFFPVNFVVVTPEPNKVVKAEQYIKISRELFIDINKNARQVSHTRQILLDDIDLTRFVTRNSIRQYNITESSTQFEWIKIDGEKKYLNKIPQAIVNWNSDHTERDRENINFFKLAQITSTTLLYKLLNDFVLKPLYTSEKDNKFEVLFRVFELNDYIAQDEFEKEILSNINRKKAKFEEQLKDIDEEIRASEANSEGSEFLDGDYYSRKKVILNEKALSFDLKTNTWLSNWFFSNTMMGAAFTMFFTSFRPYNNIIQEIEPIFIDSEKNKPIINFLIDPDKRNKTEYKLALANDQLEIKFSTLYDRIEKLKTDSLDARYTVFQRAIFADFHKVIDLLEQVLPRLDPKMRLVKYFDALSILYDKGVIDKSLTLTFEDNELFKNALYTKGYALKKVKVWTNIWISDQNESNIKYRDIDAFKIAELLRIFVIAQLTQMSLTELSGLLGNRINTSVTQVRNAYKATFTKEIKEFFELTNLNEARSRIDESKFNLELDRLINTAIENYIID